MIDPTCSMVRRWPCLLAMPGSHLLRSVWRPPSQPLKRIPKALNVVSVCENGYAEGKLPHPESAWTT